MPILAIHNEQGNLIIDGFIATVFAAMLFPRDAQQRQDFLARLLVDAAAKSRRNVEVTHDLVVRALEAEPHPLSDRGNPAPWLAGQSAGEQLLLLLALSRHAPDHASRNKVLFLLEWQKHFHSLPGSKAEMDRAWQSHRSVAHLWAPFIARDGFYKIDEFGYTSAHDGVAFLMEAELMRQFGESFKPPGRDQPILDPAQTWRVPDTWRPMKWHPDWPPRGNILWIQRLEPWMLEKLQGYPHDVPPAKKPGRRPARP